MTNLSCPHTVRLSRIWNTLPISPLCSLDGSVPALSPATGWHRISLRSPESEERSCYPHCLPNSLSGACESVQGRRRMCLCTFDSQSVCRLTPVGIRSVSVCMWVCAPTHRACCYGPRPWPGASAYLLSVRLFRSFVRPLPRDWRVCIDTDSSQPAHLPSLSGAWLVWPPASSSFLQLRPAASAWGLIGMTCCAPVNCSTAIQARHQTLVKELPRHFARARPCVFVCGTRHFCSCSFVTTICPSPGTSALFALFE